MAVEAQVPAGAKAGVIAPIDVKLPAGPTGLDPSQTNFFQTLNIPTKIVKGTIELTTEQTVCQKDKKITASQAVPMLHHCMVYIGLLYEQSGSFLAEPSWTPLWNP